MEEHIPVLLEEAIAHLKLKPSGVYVDATFGRGGHSRVILNELGAQGKLFAIDQDSKAIVVGQEWEKKYPQFKMLGGNFANIAAFLAIEEVDSVDGILFDLGVSSPQLASALRGFSYQIDGPLDMRMDNITNSVTAAQILNESSSDELIRILRNYGEEHYASAITREIIKSRPLTTTGELVSVIKRALPARVLRTKGHPAKRTFQALRIQVNRELEVLATALQQSLELLAPHGRLVVISFHSLEDQVIKSVFRQATTHPDDQLAAKLPLMIPSKATYRLIKSKPIHPTSEEVLVNNRAHSAKLWIIERP